MTRYEDVRYVSQHSELFSSAQGLLMGENLNPEINQGKLPEGAESLLQTDPPRQTQLRRLINRAFTLRRMEKLESSVRKYTLAALDDIEPGTVVNGVDDLAWRVTIDVIAELLDVPEAERGPFKEWSDSIAATVDPADEEQWIHHTVLRMPLWSYFAQRANARSETGGDDLRCAHDRRTRRPTAQHRDRRRLLHPADGGRKRNHPQPHRRRTEGTSGTTR